ncbi:MAG: hypothetical protein ACKO0W_01380 [Planctomycetota bacterium]
MEVPVVPVVPVVGVVDVVADPVGVGPVRVAIEVPPVVALVLVPAVAPLPAVEAAVAKPFMAGPFVASGPAAGRAPVPVPESPPGGRASPLPPVVPVVVDGETAGWSPRATVLGDAVDGAGVVPNVGAVDGVVPPARPVFGVSVSVSGVVRAPLGTAVAGFAPLPENALGFVAVEPDCFGGFEGERNAK